MRRREMLLSVTLPEAFQKVAYVQATMFPSYVDTEYTPNQDTRVCCKFERIEDAINPTVYGTEKPRFSFLSVRVDYGEDTGIALKKMDKNMIYCVDQNRNYVRVGSDEYMVADYTEFKCSKPLYLFLLNGYTQVHTQFLGKIYYCKIYENDVLMRNLVPCFRKEDSVIGFYDLVTEKFYLGTGTFLYGE